MERSGFIPRVIYEEFALEELSAGNFVTKELGFILPIFSSSKFCNKL
jgi:hypothetical protein